MDGSEGTSTGDSTSGSTSVPTGGQDCEGCALNLTDCLCDPPPMDDCPTGTGADGIALGAAVPGQVPTSTPETQEAEISSIVAPDGSEYVVTQVIDWEARATPGPNEPTHCIVQKGLEVYRRATPDGEFVRIPIEDEVSASETYIVDVGATTKLVWYTDPYLSVGPATGVVYLSLYKAPGIETRSCTSSRSTAETDLDEEIQLWAIRDNGENLAAKKVATTEFGESRISLGLNESYLGGGLDRSHVAAHSIGNSNDTDRVVVIFKSSVDHPTIENDPDRFVTLVCSWGGQDDDCEIADKVSTPGLQPYPYNTSGTRWPNMRVDHLGDLYISSIAPSTPRVEKFVWNDAQNVKAWESVDVGGPISINTPVLPVTAFMETDQAHNIAIEISPAIAVGRVGNASEPAVWVAWASIDATGDYGIEISAANGNDLDNWIGPFSVPKDNDVNGRSNNFSQSVSISGSRGILDVISYVAKASDEPTSYSLAFDGAIWARVSRYRAHDLEFIGQRDIGFDDAMLVNELPARSPSVGSTFSLFLGEYFGVASRDDGTSVVAWNRQVDGLEGFRRSDLYVTEVFSVCTSGVSVGNQSTQDLTLRVTCAEPEEALIGLSTFGETLSSLCRLTHFCIESSGLDLDLTAVLVEENSQRPPLGGERTLVSGALTVFNAEIINSTETVVDAIGEGTHSVKLCAIDATTNEEIGCVEQNVMVEGPLNSALDSYGHFGGRIAMDFVPLSGRPGVESLSVGADGESRIYLPASLNFSYFGTAVEVISVGANGGIQLENFSGSSASSNGTLPATGGPDVAVYWDDLDPSVQGEVLGFFDGRRYIVSWEDVRHVSSGEEISVQAHLYPDGRIELHYLDTDVGTSSYDDGASATIGIQSGTDSLLLSYNSDVLLSGTRALAIDTNDCIASSFVIPPAVACTAPEIGVTICSSCSAPVAIPDPIFASCAPEAAIVEGRITHSGMSRDQQYPRRVPLDIVDGWVEIDEGVHTIEWVARTSNGVRVGLPFTQVLHAAPWANAENCCPESQAMLISSDEPELVEGSPDDECIFARGGADTVIGGGGIDRIISGHDDDDLITGEGHNVLICEGGDDVAFGGAGEDLLDGGPGSDALSGEGDDDLIDGGTGDDVLSGGAGVDILRGRGGADVLIGGTGADHLYPGSGTDAVFGDDGDDALYLLDECEVIDGKTLSGGDGQDTLYLPPGITISDLATAGVLVDEDIENVVEMTESHTFASDCG